MVNYENRKQQMKLPNISITWINVNGISHHFKKNKRDKYKST